MYKWPVMYFVHKNKSIINMFHIILFISVFTATITNTVVHTFWDYMYIPLVNYPFIFHQSLTSNYILFEGLYIIDLLFSVTSTGHTNTLKSFFWDNTNLVFQLFLNTTSTVSSYQSLLNQPMYYFYKVSILDLTLNITDLLFLSILYLCYFFFLKHKLIIL
jgi:hypothetical protein